MATVKQRKAAAILLESNGKKSVSRSMLEAGYPATTAKNPQQLTRSKSWQELLDEYIPEEKLAKIHGQQLNATILGKNGRKVPDNDARLRALDYGYKVRGRYPKPRIEVSFIQKYQEMTDEELDQVITSLDN